MNPFTVQPLGGLNNVRGITQGMQAITQNSQAKDDERKKRAVMEQAQAVFGSGNPQDIAAFALQNPEIGKSMQEQIKFRSNETRDNMMTGMQQIIAGSDPEQVLTARAEFVEAQGGDATQTRQEIDAYRADPQGYLGQVESSYALMDPAGYTAYRKAQGVGSGADDPANIREWDRYSQMTPEEQSRYLAMKRSGQTFRQNDVTMAVDPRTQNTATPITQPGQGQLTQEEMQAEATDQQAVKAGSVKAAEQAIVKSDEAFTKLQGARTAQSNLTEAIRLVDEGAETGPIISMLPSVQQASVELDNLQGRLGLDVIGNTTFGALSESELKFALDTALPTKLKGPELKKWLERKRESQQKLTRYLEEGAIYLGTPGNTVAKFLKMQQGGGQPKQTESGPIDRKDADDFINSALGM